MHRLFVGLALPAAMRAALLAVMGGIAGARWQNEDQLHITLRFIGEVDGPLANDIATALSTIHAPPLDVAVAGVGQFDRRGRSHTLWAGVAPAEPLARLHSKVDMALQRVGLASEGRKYVPHITLARMNLPIAALDGFLSARRGLCGPPVAIEHFLLYESRLGRDGAVYDAVARYPLDARLTPR